MTTEKTKKQSDSTPEVDQNSLNMQRQDTIKRFLFEQVNAKYIDLISSIRNVPCLDQFECLKVLSIQHIDTGYLWLKEFFQAMHLKPFDQPKVQVLDVESKSN